MKENTNPFRTQICSEGTGFEGVSGVHIGATRVLIEINVQDLEY